MTAFTKNQAKSEIGFLAVF